MADNQTSLHYTDYYYLDLSGDYAPFYDMSAVSLYLGGNFMSIGEYLAIEVQSGETKSWKVIVKSLAKIETASSSVPTMWTKLYGSEAAINHINAVYEDFVKAHKIVVYYFYNPNEHQVFKSLLNYHNIQPYILGAEQIHSVPTDGSQYDKDTFEIMRKIFSNWILGGTYHVTPEYVIDDGMVKAAFDKLFTDPKFVPHSIIPKTAADVLHRSPRCRMMLIDRPSPQAADFLAAVKAAMCRGLLVVIIVDGGVDCETIDAAINEQKI